jgi:predicted DNA-binding protein
MGETVPENFETSTYSIKVKAELDTRLSNHIRALKYLNGGYTKRRFVQEAIKEKIESFDIEKVRSDCTLNFGISSCSSQEIGKMVKILKKLKVQSSKSQFFLEAICEKLEKDEKNVKELFQNMLKSASENSNSLASKSQAH